MANEYDIYLVDQPCGKLVCLMLPTPPSPSTNSMLMDWGMSLGMRLCESRINALNILEGGAEVLNSWVIVVTPMFAFYKNQISDEKQGWRISFSKDIFELWRWWTRCMGIYRQELSSFSLQIQVQLGNTDKGWAAHSIIEWTHVLVGKNWPIGGRERFY